MNHFQTLRQKRSPKRSPEGYHSPIPSSLAGPCRPEPSSLRVFYDIPPISPVSEEENRIFTHVACPLFLTGETGSDRPAGPERYIPGEVGGGMQLNSFRERIMRDRAVGGALCRRGGELGASR
ncbi:hypothetical protein JTE90_009178 [Oedothorax gibbosus]|uniref:Uncharacterized protein n=1 Tax=Oedothorax gibbosus TaxID=931172 RepID=A0AAV6UYN3_9ARAC|nr:hypothetical protein JTE90_009178 [Oedothorax gibbosus]